MLPFWDRISWKPQARLEVSVVEDDPEFLVFQSSPLRAEITGRSTSPAVVLRMEGRALAVLSRHSAGWEASVTLCFSLQVYYYWKHTKAHRWRTEHNSVRFVFSLHCSMGYRDEICVQPWHGASPAPALAVFDIIRFYLFLVLLDRFFFFSFFLSALCPGSGSVAQAGLIFTELHLLLPPKCWK